MLVRKPPLAFFAIISVTVASMALPNVAANSPSNGRFCLLELIGSSGDYVKFDSILGRAAVVYYETCNSNYKINFTSVNGGLMNGSKDTVIPYDIVTGKDASLISTEVMTAIAIHRSGMKDAAAFFARREIDLILPPDLIKESADCTDSVIIELAETE